MYKNKKILAVITARGGSKGILGKNIKLLNGKPLIAYTIQSAIGSQHITRCVVSTDDAQIAKISSDYGAEVPFLRPAQLAQEKSTSVDVAKHALGWLEKNQNEHYDYVMILQPTSPLRTSEDIDNCIKKIVNTGADSVMSMVELPDFSLKKLKKIDNDVIYPLIEEEGRQSGRRQDASRVYKRNCAIYLTKTELIAQGDLFGSVSRPYIMPEERSVDINKLIDFGLAEFFLRKK